jgi:O-antigen ligase
MRSFLLVSLFVILLSDIMFGLGLSLAPGLSLKNAMLYILFSALVLEFLLSNRDSLRETWPLHGGWALLVFYAFFTWLTIVLLGLHRGYEAVGSFIILKSQLADLFLFLLVYLYGPKDTQSTIKILRVLIALLVFINVVTIIDYLNIPDLGIIGERHDGRVTGPVQGVNAYGLVLIFLIPVTAGLMLASTGLSRLVFAVGSVMAVVLLGLTVSRGSWVGLIVGGVLAMYFVRDHVRRDVIFKGAIVVLLILAITAVSLAVINPEGFLSKFSFSSGADLNSVSSGRVDVWRRVLTKMSYWPMSFITGYGWNGYRTLIGIYGDPHNTYLLYWFNLGLIGLSMYLYIVIWTIRYAVTSLNLISVGLKPLVIGFIIGFTAIHIGMFFSVMYTASLFIWALVATVLRVIADDRSRMRAEATEVAEEE